MLKFIYVVNVGQDVSGSRRVFCCSIMKVTREVGFCSGGEMGVYRSHYCILVVVGHIFKIVLHEQLLLSLLNYMA